MKMSNYLPLTKKQLGEVVECYAMAFPSWELVNRVVLVRKQGPVAQEIGFEALRSGPYRPMGAMSSLPLPTVAMLHQFLDIKHRQVRLRDHAAKWKGVVAAMEEQFRPAIRKPLDLWEVKRLCEQAARETTNDMCMLAILNAYLGEKEKALSCCDRMQDLPPPTLAPRMDWEQRHKAFGRKLREAIGAGRERQFLDAAMKMADECT